MFNENCLTYEKCSEMIKKGRAVVDGCKAKKLAKNTYLYFDGESYHVRLWNTDIVSVLPGNRWILDNGGWWTKLSSERINRYAPVQVRKDRGDWFYVLGDTVFPFERGKEISRDALFEELV